MKGLFAPLVRGWPVALEEMDPREAPLDLGLLHPSEVADVSARAVDSRRRERVAGRLLARKALARLGVVAPVPAGEDRAPRWPPGMVGSITHTTTHAAVAVARREELEALGLDVEGAAPLEEPLFARILTARERALARALPAAEAGRRAKVVFSAKECAYKAQYARSKTYLGFEAMEIRLEGGGETGRFEACFTADVPGHFRAGDVIPGRWRIAGSLVATACRMG
ncbi:MAG: 4'-phosphopantetheinyl transferase superfamily protein [Myxococcota bacterium]